MVYNVNKKLVSKCQLSKQSPIFTISIQSLNQTLSREEIRQWIPSFNAKRTQPYFEGWFTMWIRSLSQNANSPNDHRFSQYRSKVWIRRSLGVKSGNDFHSLMQNGHNHIWRYVLQCEWEACLEMPTLQTITDFHNIDSKGALHCSYPSMDYFWDQLSTRDNETITPNFSEKVQNSYEKLDV